MGQLIISVSVVQLPEWAKYLGFSKFRVFGIFEFCRGGGEVERYIYVCYVI